MNILVPEPACLAEHAAEIKARTMSALASKPFSLLNAVEAVVYARLLILTDAVLDDFYAQQADNAVGHVPARNERDHEWREAYDQARAAVIKAVSK